MLRAEERIESIDSADRPADPASADDGLAQVRQALRGLTFGTVTIAVQDGVVVQIERTEKVRLDRPARRRAP